MYQSRQRDTAMHLDTLADVPDVLAEIAQWFGEERDAPDLRRRIITHDDVRTMGLLSMSSKKLPPAAEALAMAIGNACKTVWFRNHDTGKYRWSIRAARWFASLHSVIVDSREAINFAEQPAVELFQYSKSENVEFWMYDDLQVDVAWLQKLQKPLHAQSMTAGLFPVSYTYESYQRGNHGLPEPTWHLDENDTEERYVNRARQIMCEIHRGDDRPVGARRVIEISAFEITRDETTWGFWNPILYSDYWPLNRTVLHYSGCNRFVLSDAVLNRLYVNDAIGMTPSECLMRLGEFDAAAILLLWRRTALPASWPEYTISTITKMISACDWHTFGIAKLLVWWLNQEHFPESVRLTPVARYLENRQIDHYKAFAMMLSVCGSDQWCWLTHLFCRAAWQAVLLPLDMLVAALTALYKTIGPNCAAQYPWRDLVDLVTGPWLTFIGTAEHAAQYEDILMSLTNVMTADSDRTVHLRQYVAQKIDILRPLTIHRDVETVLITWMDACNA